jgi:autotransporter-associated beta strand protein
MLKRSFCAQRELKRNRSKSFRPRAELMEPRTLLSGIVWTGGAGDNNWNTPANWDANRVPGSTDDVTINISAHVDHSNSSSDSIHSLTSTQPLEISGGTLSIAAASTINEVLSITGGTLTGTGDVSVSGLVTLTAGTLSGASALNANGGMLIDSAGSATFGYFYFDGRTVNNPVGRTATWDGSISNIQASNGSVFNNFGTFVVKGTGTYSDAGSGAAASFVNRGSFIKSESFDRAEIDVQFDLSGGSVDIKTGLLELGGGGSSTAGALNIESDGGIRFQNVYTFDTSTTIVGSGALIQNGFTTLVLPGKYAFTGETQVYEGTLQVDGSLTASAVTLGSGTLSGTGTVAAVQGGAGAVSPGDGPDPGILYAHGDVVLPDEGSFTVTLNGTTAGSGYSQLNVTGSVDLAETSLNASLGFTPASGEQFTIIKSTAPIVRTFAGLSEGATFPIGNSLFTITYHGGTGNDVVLNQSGTVQPDSPSVTDVIPATGYESGGTLVTLLGSGFTGVTEVDFGTAQGTDIKLQSDGVITVKSPPGTGVVPVTVTTPAGTSSVSALDQFTYTPTPATQVTGISPNTGPAEGGTSVTLTGLGFTEATTVEFGATPATEFTIVSDTTITATSPPGTNTVDVTVVTPNGTSPATIHDQFTYGPTVTGISPNSGPEAGGTSVTITGTGFASVAEVDFGSTLALGSVEFTDTTITIDSPPGTGIVNVTVRTANGTSTPSPADRFTYIAAATPAPAVTAISPNSGPEAGGTHVKITGAGFAAATAVDFGTTPATGVTVVNDTTITADSPAGTGTVHVTVISPSGRSPISPADQFTYAVVSAPPPPETSTELPVQTAASPRVVSVARFGYHMQPTSLVVAFSTPLDSARAEDVNNYEFVTIGGRGRNAAAVGHVTHVRAAVYDPARMTVTLYTAERLDIHNKYRLTVKGTAPHPLKGVSGTPLDGRGDGKTATNYVTVISGKLLKGPAPAAASRALHHFRFGKQHSLGASLGTNRGHRIGL